MKNQARVVIVGGGMMGAGLLYHLAEEGWSDGDIALYLDRKLQADEAIATAVGLEQAGNPFFG